MKMRLALLTVLVLSLSAAAACGGDSDASVEEYRDQANDVCRDVERQLDEIQRTLPATAEQAEKQAEAVIDVSEQALDNLRQVDAPEEVQGTYDRYLSEREAAIEFIEQARDAAADKDSGAYEQAKRRLAAGQPTRRQLALKAGLSACSRPSVPE